MIYLQTLRKFSCPRSPPITLSIFDNILINVSLFVISSYLLTNDLVKIGPKVWSRNELFDHSK